MAPHEPYISRVVRALVAAGIEVGAWRAELRQHDPLDAAIALPVDRTLVWLGWDEETGWHYGPQGDEGLEWARWLDVDLLAEPDVIVYAVQKCVLGDEPALDDTPHYRAETDNPAEFLDNLRAAGGER